MIIKCNSIIIEIIFAIFNLANNFYTIYLVIYNKDCAKYNLYDVAILSIVCNMITFSLVSIFIARHMENRYYEMLLIFFMGLSAGASTLLLSLVIKYNIINGIHCSHTFFYIVMVNCISSIIPICMCIIFLTGMVMFYIPYDIINRKIKRYVQTDPEILPLIKNESNNMIDDTFVFPPDESDESYLDAIEM